MSSRQPTKRSLRLSGSLRKGKRGKVEEGPRQPERVGLTKLANHLATGVCPTPAADLVDEAYGCETRWTGIRGGQDHKAASFRVALLGRALTNLPPECLVTCAEHPALAFWACAAVCRAVPNVPDYGDTNQSVTQRIVVEPLAGEPTRSALRFPGASFLRNADNQTQHAETGMLEVYVPDFVRLLLIPPPSGCTLLDLFRFLAAEVHIKNRPADRPSTA